MKYGYFSVEELLAYAKTHPYPANLREKKYSVTYNGYKAVFKPLIEQVPEIPGWYAWLEVDDGDLKIIYVGKSGKGKTSDVRARLDEEFRDERVAFWATVHEEIRKWNPTWKYANETKRALRKAGVTHIIWLGQKGLTENQVKRVESNLIDKYAPTANMQRKTIEADAKLLEKAVEAFEKAVADAKRS